MVEFGLRALVAGAVLFLAGVFRVLDFDFAWKAAAAIIAIVVFANRLEARGMRNPGVAGFFAVADSFTIAMICVGAGRLETFGFLVLVPCISATLSAGAQAASMAPLAASSLVVAQIALGKGMPTPLLLAQAAAVLAVCLLLGRWRPSGETLQPTYETAEIVATIDEQEFFEVRESYRKLRDAYRDLERKSREDHLAVLLEEARPGKPEHFLTRLTEKLRELTGAQGVAVYILAHHEDTMVVRSVSGAYPDEIKESSVPVDLSLSPGLIRERSERALRALGGEKKGGFANVLLVDRGKIVGMLCITHQEGDRLQQAEMVAQDMAFKVCEMIVEENQRQIIERRLAETELMYELAAVANGACTQVTLASRIVAQLAEILPFDHLSIRMVEGMDSTCLAQHGFEPRFFELVTFGDFAGVPGWIQAGAPETVLFDTRGDSRCPANEAIKRRVGSLGVIPIHAFAQPAAFIMAATHSSGGIDTFDLETLRVVAAEFGRALERLQTKKEQPEGLMTPREFQGHLSSNAGGHLVYIEPLKKDELQRIFGKPAIQHALRTFASRLRAQLPSGGAICRRHQGDYVVWLPTDDERFSTSWATDAAATASLIPITTPDGSTRIPLAMRAKVAPLVPQENEVFDKLMA